MMIYKNSLREIYIMWKKQIQQIKKCNILPNIGHKFLHDAKNQ